MNIDARTVDDSRVETVHIVRPNHLNGVNRLFGGHRNSVTVTK